MVKSTKNRMPLELIYTEDFETKKDARKREIEIKKMKGGVEFRRLVNSRR